MFNQIDLTSNPGIQDRWIKIFQCLVCNLKTVTDSIRINKCQISSKQISKISKLMKEFSKKINKLSYYSCPLIQFHANKLTSDTNQDIIRLYDSIFELSYKTLEVIEIGEEEKKSAFPLSQFISVITAKEEIALQEIVLRNQKGFGKSLVELFNCVFKVSKYFRKFDISGNNISDDEMAQIIQYYSTSNNKSLKQVVIKNNPEIGQQSYKLIAEHMVFTNNSSVQKINISDNQITKKKFKDFIKIGKKFLSEKGKNEKLKKFIFNSQSEMEDNSFKEIIDLFFFNNQIISLNKLSLKKTLTITKAEIIIKKMSELENEKQKLSLKQLSLDYCNFSSSETMVELTEAFLLKNKVCLELERLSFVNHDNQILNNTCSRFDNTVEIFLKQKQFKYSPVNLKKLILRGNDNITPKGWDLLSELLFQKFLDLSMCNLKEKSVTSLCKFNSYQSVKNQSKNCKQPLKELVLDENPLLNSKLWKKIFENIIFSHYSQIESLSAQKSGFDSQTMDYFTEIVLNQKYKLSSQKQTNKKLRLQLVNLNIGNNLGINEDGWYYFIQNYLLNSVKQSKQQQQKDDIIEQEYTQNLNEIKEQLQVRLNKTTYQNVFKIKSLDLEGTKSINQDQWAFLFDELIINQKSQIQFLNLTNTEIQTQGWKSIFKIIQNYKKGNNHKLKIERIEFNKIKKLNTYIWKNIARYLFFNSDLLDLKQLGLDDCDIDQDICEEFKNYMRSPLELEILSLRNNKMTDLLFLQTRRLPKLKELYVSSPDLPIKLNLPALKIISEESQIFSFQSDAFLSKKENPYLEIEKSECETIIQQQADRWESALFHEDNTEVKFKNDSLSQKYLDRIPQKKFSIIKDFLEIIKPEFTPRPKKNQTVDESSGQEESTDMDQILCFDYQTMLSLANYYTELNRNTYKKKCFVILFLNYEISDYLSKSSYQNIFFIEHEHLKVNTKQIEKLFRKFKESKIDSIIINYEFRQSDLDSSLSENDLVDLIRLFPPKSIELTNVSINALKAIYSILSSNENFRSANINFSSQSFLNNGIAFSSRESLIHGKKTKNNFLNFLKKIAYALLSLFCAEEEIYEFNKTISDLNEKLEKRRMVFNIIILLTFIYYAICILCPYFLTVYYGVYIKTKPGVAWESHYVYGSFAFISFIVEVTIYYFVNKVINVKKQIRSIIDAEKQQFGMEFKIFLLKNSQLHMWFSCCLGLFFSQIDRFDLYSDICFIVVCFKMEQNFIGIIGLILILIQIFSNISKLLYFLLQMLVRDKKRKLNTYQINSLCELSNLIEFEALSDILDRVAPYNISYIPNNLFIKFFFPSLAGKSISNRLLIALQKFLLEDFIQIVLQATFVFASHEKDITVAVSIFTSLFSIIKGFYKFMSIRPSSISQLDFDSLSKQKTDQENHHNIQLNSYRNNMIKKLKNAIQKDSNLLSSIDKNNSPSEEQKRKQDKQKRKQEKQKIKDEKQKLKEEEEEWEKNTNIQESLKSQKGSSIHPLSQSE